MAVEHFQRLADKATITFECHPELEPVRSNAMASGDDAEDKAVEDAIIADLENGNEWAWCMVKCTARVDGFPGEGVDWLGGCSYASEAEFMRDVYSEGMRNEARRALAYEMEQAARAMGLAD